MITIRELRQARDEYLDARDDLAYVAEHITSTGGRPDDPGIQAARRLRDRAFFKYREAIVDYQMYVTDFGGADDININRLS